MYFKAIVAGVSIITFDLAGAACMITQNSGLSFSCPFNQYFNCASTATISMTCSSETPLTLTLNQGGANSFVPRQLSEPLHNYRVNYNIYLDPNRNQIFGDGTQGTMVLSTTCAGACSYNLYGYIQSSAIKAGTYSDITILTVNY